MSIGWQLPNPGDIVWCQFPEVPDTSPGPKPRPAIVVSVETRDDGVRVRVAYGTSKRVNRLKSGEFSILRSVHPAAFDLAGLAFDTKFDFKVIEELPWSDRYFKVPPRAPYGQSPKLGVLHPSLMHAARAAYDAALHR